MLYIRRYCLSAVSFALLLCLCMFSSAGFAQRQKKVVFVIADGIPADVLERVATPHIDSITWQGSYLRAHAGGEKDGYSQTPTISAVGYNSLLTGTWANKHNVWGNDITAPNYHYWNIFRFFKQQYPQGKTGIFSSWTDNRTKLIGDTIAAAGNIKMDYSFDGYELDTVHFPHDKARDFMHQIDETVVEAASQAIRKQAPELSWVYLEYTDDMGHMYGDSPQFYKAVGMMDVQMGKLWRAIQYRQQHFAEDWLIIITTDHGRDEMTGRNHGGQTTRQRSTWIATNYKNLNAYARYYQPGIVDIMPTIARYLNISIATDKAVEIDGTPLIGKVSVAEVRTNLLKDYIDLSWTALDTAGKVTILMATTNNFRQGGADGYKKIATVPVSTQHILIPVKEQSALYKIVLKAPGNTTNRWVMPQPEKK